MVSAALAVALTALIAAAAIANDAAINDGANGPQPLGVTADRESPIRMVSEELVFRFGKWRTRVEAKFLFENTRADSTVRQLSGFPDATVYAPYFRSDPGFRDREISQFDARIRQRNPLRNMQTRIDGKRVASPMRMGFVARPDGAMEIFTVAVDTMTADRVAWHVVELVIPPRGRLTLERRYEVNNSFNDPFGAGFIYVTATGASWQGTIARLHATLYLEDGLTFAHLPHLWQGGDGPEPDDETWDPGWTILGPNRAELTWLDHEPRTDWARNHLDLDWYPLPGEYYPPWQIVQEQWESPLWMYPCRPPFDYPHFAMYE